MTAPRRLVIGISGASGVVYGVRLLEVLLKTEIETHLVVSKSAEMTLAYETGRKLAELHEMADHVHAAQDLGAAISSGSFKTIGMIVAPCSIRSLAEIAFGTTTTLLTRAADVVLKERRRLVLMVRETPLHLGHLRAMVAAAENGAIILPPVPGFYALPQSVADIVDQSVGRALDLFDIETDLVKRWGEPAPDEARPGKAPRRGLKPVR
jgi:4-hydroxy-3-polyprenylbenzoate decarboxylase